MNERLRTVRGRRGRRGRHGYGGNKAGGDARGHRMGSWAMTKKDLGGTLGASGQRCRGPSASPHMAYAAAGWLALLSGCASAGLPHPSTGAKDDASSPGRAHCVAVETSAHAAAIARSEGAWALTGLTTALLGTATALTVADAPAKGEGDDADYYGYKITQVSLAATSVVFAAATAYMFERAGAASKAAAEAAEATNLDDEQARAACNSIIATWHSERTSSLRSASESAAAAKIRQSVKDASDKAETAAKKAEEAAKEAKEAAKDASAGKANPGNEPK